MGILIQTKILKFSKTKNLTQKRPPKVPKNQKHIYGGLKSKSFIKQTPLKVGILIQNTISKFSKTKNKTKKRPPKIKKKSKQCIRRLQIKKLKKTDQIALT